MSKYQAPQFSIALLHPKYWGVWFGFGLLFATVTLLPYKMTYKLGRGLGLLGLKMGKSRSHVARRNLELAFPKMEAKEREAIIVENFKNSGLAIFETAMAWVWPNWRIEKHFSFENKQHMLDLEKEGRGVLVVCVHALNLELTARAFTFFSPGYGVYRPHNNPAYDFIQYWGRTNNGNQMIDRKDIKGMLRVLRKGGRLWYMPDHDYNRNKSVFVPFFAVPDACTTVGSDILISASKCAVVTASGFRTYNNYHLQIDNDISDQFPQKDPVGSATVMNQAVERIILRCIPQWMWLHKRFKTMEDPNIKKGIRYD
ncbi:LpxL/LpxP family Kdo(2)-lipid IV(A) lauroyl/palmitoleoyl acyltransferase [Aliivibrio sifiae]|uniref:Lipid A biosynthesis acyltransferase n=1 Tax=Aliivibrio sifiae TaxID=566293 RepID=A0A2S7X0I8_9GAMM|nr:LpxL/LpxP family Kdo(2)-lipid IV(A) lauroyl/palmitoleoyl acyltransferase [Aliivibrio sifiae]PQJ83285.1 lipid A biosynthesis lauroyl acyltransferase [Aliivibrio sifiae]